MKTYHAPRSGIVAYRVMGNDYAVTLAAHSGQLQLNAYEPLAGFASIESQNLLYNVSILLRSKCIDGITACALCRPS